MELLLTGDRIDATRAKEIGLAGWVVPHDDLMAEARRLADRLVRAAPIAARATKEVAVRTQHMSTVEAIRFGETMRKVAGMTEDAAGSERGRFAVSVESPRPLTDHEHRPAPSFATQPGSPGRPCAR